MLSRLPAYLSSIQPVVTAVNTSDRRPRGEKRILAPYVTPLHRGSH
jgi:hypothetical protein